MSEKKRVSLRIGIENALTSIELESGYKYRRFFTIAYLPTKDDLPSCLCIGNLEVSKETGKEFYNPTKFYHPEKLWEALANMLAAFIAFKSIKTGRPLHSCFNITLNQLYGDRGLRLKLRNLAEAYHKAMLKLESKS